MKKHLLALLSIIFWITLQAQQNSPLPLTSVDPSLTWRILAFGGDTILYEYKFKGDTLINDTVYNKLYSFNFKTSERTYAGGLRQVAEGIVAFKKATSMCSPKPEKIIYNFNLQPGDSSEDQQCSDLFYKIETIDSIFIDGQYKKRLIYNPFELPDMIEECIEGIGSTYNLIIPHANYCIQSYSYKLVCAKRSNDVVYINPEFNNCDYGLDISEKLDENTMQIIQTENYLILFLTEKAEQISLLNSFGQTVYTKRPLQNTIHIPVSEYPSGVYFLRILKSNYQPLVRKLVIKP